MPKKTLLRASIKTRADALTNLRESLRDELEEFETNLPANVQDISEAHERYARVVTLMLRSLDMLVRFERQAQKDINKTEEVRATRDIFTEIERRLGRIAANRQETDNSESPHG